LDDRGSIPGRVNYGDFLFATASRPALGPIQPPIQGVLVDLSSGRKAAGIVKLTAHHHLVMKLKTAWGYTSTPPWCIVKHDEKAVIFGKVKKTREGASAKS
jgi:hypothetical protein